MDDFELLGVFAQPSTSKEGSCGGKCTYIAASYVKYLEAAGARVVPVDFYASESELDKLFSSLNGFFFTGSYHSNTSTSISQANVNYSDA